MSKSVFVKTKGKVIQFTLSHSNRLSKGGYFHLPFFVMLFGSNGVGIYFLSLYFGVSITPRVKSVLMLFTHR